ncbi:MAG: nicotinate-nucleotide adenylyltransferase [Bacteroidaceae bacterium]|nr:nicotinate-nucleotide adenylyltransferase [Bacteroidaceae bacterium]
MRIGIFGGSFNPIHLGHTALAAYICEQGLVDEVWLMVSPQNPLKQDLTLLDEEERLAMARLAVAPYPMLRACNFEFTLPRPSYTYHTLQALRTAYPEHEFSLIIGEDNWQCFHRWYRGDDIVRETPIIVYPRSSENSEHSESTKELSTFNFQLSILEDPPLLPYSSTEIRHRIATGQDASHMLHPDIAKYITEKHHYTQP